MADETTLCECGCGETCSPGRRFVDAGHSRRGVGLSAELIILLAGGPMKMRDIYEELGNQHSYSTLATQLSRMKARGDVENVRGAGWALPGTPIELPRHLRTERVNCACGCGETRLRYDEYGNERRFIYGHQSRRAS